MNEIQEGIWQYLLKNAMGIDHVISIPHLANAMGFRPAGSNYDNFRQILNSMVMVHGVQIGTCDRGVFVITNEEELDIAIEFVSRRTKADALRENGIYRPE